MKLTEESKMMIILIIVIIFITFIIFILGFRTGFDYRDSEIKVEINNKT